MNSRESYLNKVLLAIIILLIFAIVVIVSFFIYDRQTNITANATTSPTPIKDPSLIINRDPKGPYYHQIYTATSADGKVWTKTNTQIFDHASVPGAIIKDGIIYVYFVDAAGDEDQLSVGISNDLGKTFEKKPVFIKDMNSILAFDPRPVLINDRIRLYFFKNPKDNLDKKEVFQFFASSSTDGINFNEPTLIYENDTLATDPDVFKTANDWRMFISAGKDLILTTSKDSSLDFKKESNFTWNKGGVSETVDIGGTLTTFYCGEGGIRTATGAETGTLTEGEIAIPSTDDEITCDPTIIKLEDNTYLMFYKVQANDKKPIESKKEF